MVRSRLLWLEYSESVFEDRKSHLLERIWDLTKDKMTLKADGIHGDSISHKSLNYTVQSVRFAVDTLDTIIVDAMHILRIECM